VNGSESVNGPAGDLSAGTGLALTDVTVDLGGVRVVDGIGASAGPGQWITLVGPNGAGKSTLLRAVAGLVRHGGSVRVGGDEVRSLRPAQRGRRIAYAPQDPIVPPGMPVEEYVLLGRAPYLGYLARPGRADRAAAHEVIDRLDLGGLGRRTLDTLSGGERRRVVLARALVQLGRSGARDGAPAELGATPGVLVLDEPTSALDIGHAQQVLELVDALRRAERLIVVAALHDLTLAGQYADRLLLLVGGRVVSSGPPADVLTAEAVAAHYDASVVVEHDDRGGVAVRPVRP
jgi:iron complex transport system ATP-binding protein